VVLARRRRWCSVGGEYGARSEAASTVGSWTGASSAVGSEVEPHPHVCKGAQLTRVDGGGESEVRQGTVATGEAVTLDIVAFIRVKSCCIDRE
jgi:hypothetical protein